MISGTLRLSFLVQCQKMRSVAKRFILLKSHILFSLKLTGNIFVEKFVVSLFFYVSLLIVSCQYAISLNSYFEIGL